jgi:acetyl esterase/lipase
MTSIDSSLVTIEKDVVFGRGGDRDLFCDVYRPPLGTEKATAIIHIHGGGFRGGSKEGARTARPLAALGYVCVAMQYRLSGEAKWPAQIEDVKACIRWVRANAENLGCDAAKVAVCGYSAGGQLALVAAGSQNNAAFEGLGGNAGAGTAIAACIAFYPPVRMERRPDGMAPEVMPADATDDALKNASPTSHVAPGFPPTIILHGTADKAVALGGSLRLFEALTEARVPVELHALEGLDHVFDSYPEFADLSAHAIDLFVDRHVVNPRAYPGTLGRPAAVPAATHPSQDLGLVGVPSGPASSSS